MPRVLVEVIYNDNFIDGELDYVSVNYNKEDLELRSIDDFTFDLKELGNFIEINKEKIHKVRIYKNAKVNITNIPSNLEILPL